MDILIDAGSSSVKVYTYDGKNLSLTLTKSFVFKDGFSPEKGISQENTKGLFSFIQEMKTRIAPSSIFIYGTALYRKLTPEAQELFIKKVKKKTGAEFIIITQEQENNYLEHALIDKYHTNKPLLLINIGGGSTELVVVKEGHTIERKNIDLGVVSINSEFPQLNEEYSGNALSEVVQYIKKRLGTLHHSTKIAFYTGGELNYMQRTRYNLTSNNLFEDNDHPSIISLVDFKNRNEEIFNKVSLDELRGFMSENPDWMLGARSCSSFAQAICEKYGITTIIPSNSNLINGIIRKDFKQAENQ